MGSIVRYLGRVAYKPTWERMKRFTEARDGETADELWIVEHPPVYTLGQTGREEHLLAPGDIEIVKTDRGGQVTYHGPGQIVCYLMIDLKRLGLGVRDLVTGIEQSVIKLLAAYGINAEAKKEAPGVYVEDVKVAALGLRVKRGCSYHGLSLNVDMDLAPFAGINPCGYEGLAVTDLRHLNIATAQTQLAEELVQLLVAEFGYDAPPRVEHNF